MLVTWFLGRRERKKHKRERALAKVAERSFAGRKPLGCRAMEIGWIRVERRLGETIRYNTAGGAMMEGENNTTVRSRSSETRVAGENGEQ